MPAASKLSKLLSGVERFIVANKGKWGHDEWEDLVKNSQALGYPFDEDDCRRNLGNILEAGKYFYLRESSDAPAPAKKAVPAKKVTSRKKASS